MKHFSNFNNLILLGNQIRESRIKHQLSLEALAEKVGCSAEDLETFEAALCPPPLEVLSRLSFVFHWDLSCAFASSPSIVAESPEPYYAETPKNPELFQRKSVYTSEDYWNLPYGQRAELIDGQLIKMESPSRIHQEILINLSVTICNYIKKQGGNCQVYPAPFAVNLSKDEKTWVEPDINVICDESILSDRGCEGAPDWVIEIVSPSTQRRDYLQKLNLYEKNGVDEYWIINPVTRNVTVYYFKENLSENYSFQDQIPVNLYQGKLSLCLDEILA